MGLVEKSDVTDGAIIEEKISELKSQWEDICALSVERCIFQTFIVLLSPALSCMGILFVYLSFAVYF